MYSQIQSLLLKKLPRLGELSFGCGFYIKKVDDFEILPYKYGKYTFLSDYDDYEDHFKTLKTWWVNFRAILWWHRGDEEIRHLQITTFLALKKRWNIEILWHPFTHTDILEALGEEYALFWNFELVFFDNGGWDHTFLQLPRDLRELDKPEYKETAKHLIS